MDDNGARQNFTQVSLNLNVRGLAQSATLSINERCAEMARRGRKVYRLGLGQSPFPVPRPVVEALRLHAPQKDYLPVRGLPALREAVAEFHRRKDQVAAQADCVIVGPGSKELLFLLQLVYYGEIIVPTPCWVSYVPQARIVGRNVRLIHTTFEEKWRLSTRHLLEMFEADRDDLRPRLLVLNYPGNPEGSSYNVDELKKIGEVARQYNLILLSDEIYGQLHHGGQHVSVARFYPEGTIISSGLSKWCGAGGWRLGTFTFPPNLKWLMEAMAVVASETYTAVSAPIQYAAVEAFRCGYEIERYLSHARRILRALGERCTEILARTGIRVHDPIGAFYLFIDFTPFERLLAKLGIRDSPTLCEQLLQETGVAILPGASFERPATELTARLAYVNFDGSKVLSASERIPLDQELPDGFVEELCPEPLQAVTLLAEWLEKKKQG